MLVPFYACLAFLLRTFKFVISTPYSHIHTYIHTYTHTHIHTYIKWRAGEEARSSGEGEERAEEDQGHPREYEASSKRGHRTRAH